MLRFNNDYNRTAAASALAAVCGCGGSYPGYGADEVCARAAELVRKTAGCPNADVHFFPGATQANFIIISAALSPVESAICAASGHVNAHEAGSIENAGHKLLALPHREGKLSAADIAACAAEYYDGEPDYLTVPRLVYISFPTEFGTVYTLSELRAISGVCRKYGMYLFVDGARLGYGLTAEGGDVTASDIASLADVFYFGGTKCGALFGEAVVITNDALKPRFRNYMKQNGAVLAKGWLLGAQFEALLSCGDYFTLTARANRQAMRIRRAFEESGIEMQVNSTTNQQFALLPEKAEAALSKNYIYEFEGKTADGRTVARFCTSWATTDEEVEALIADIKRL